MLRVTYSWSGKVDNSIVEVAVTCTSILYSVANVWELYVDSQLVDLTNITTGSSSGAVELSGVVGKTPIIAKGFESNNKFWAELWARDKLIPLTSNHVFLPPSS